MSSLKISNRLQRAQFSPIRKLAPLASAAKKNGIKVYHLNIGQPDFETPKEIKEAIKNFKNNLTYAPSEGLEEARAAWQKYYKDWGIKINKEDIIITTGGSEAIIFAMTAICDPDEEILVFEPFYTNYAGYASQSGIKLTPVTLSIKNGFHLPDEEKIIKKINKKTRGILVCNPSNPTGTIFTKKELQTISKIAKKYKLFVLADEVYREFVFDGKRHQGLMEFPKIKNQVILLDSASKRFNMCGGRVGVLVSRNKKVVQSILKLAQARLSAATLEQLAVTPLLTNSKKYIKRLVKEYEARRNVVFDALKNIKGVACQKPEGAFYIIAKLPIKNTEHFSKWLLTSFQDKKETVILAPAKDFYASPNLGRDEVRIAYVLNQRDLARAIEILKKGIGKYKR
jgi:aspartate aminotransferase